MEADADVPAPSSAAQRGRGSGEEQCQLGNPRHCRASSPAQVPLAACCEAEGWTSVPCVPAGKFSATEGPPNILFVFVLN